MTNAKHTPEPCRVGRDILCQDWQVSPDRPYEIILTRPIDTSGKLHVLATTYGYTEGEDAAIATLIVACVNACAGINPEAVPDLLEALRKTAALLSDFEDALDGGRLDKMSVHLGTRKRYRTLARDFSAEARAAIAKVTGRE